MNTSRAVLGVLAGIAAGAAIGVLLAPRKGDRAKASLLKKEKILQRPLIGESMRNLTTSWMLCIRRPGSTDRKKISSMVNERE